MPSFTGTANADTLNGTVDSDILVGLAGADILNGGGGNDTIYAGSISPGWSIPWNNNPYVAPVLDTAADADTIAAGAGDDQIFAGYGDDVDGGADTDSLLISFRGASAGVTADFRLLGTDGSGSLTVGGGTIQGIERIPWIEGSNFADTIYAPADPYGWADFTPIFGLGGDDHIVGGQLSGNLYGGDGNDTVDGSLSTYGKYYYGGAGNDTVLGGVGFAYGDEGNDTIWSFNRAWGGSGDDVLNGEWTGSTIFLWGGDGNDTINGSGQGDILRGNAGADIIFGGGGDDTLYSAGAQDSGTENEFDYGLDFDQLSGGGGNDELIIGYGDSADGGDGTDSLFLVTAGATSGLNIDLTDLVNGANVGGGVIKNIEILEGLSGTAFADHITIGGFQAMVLVTGGSGDDVLTATTSSVYFLAGAGNDTLTGSSAGDSLEGDIGDDVISGGGGNDNIRGGDGDDLVAGNAGNDEIWGGSGFDRVSYANALAGVTVSLNFALASATGGDGQDYLHEIEGLIGSAFTDTLTGDFYSNIIEGGAGDDVLDGREGIDQLIGGTGNDSYYADGADTLVEAAGEGTDTVFSSISHTLGTNFERLTLIGDGSIVATGNALDNVLVGNSGNNLIDGKAGADSMSGGAGDDTFIVDQSGDTVSENASEGTDTVQSVVTFTLGANVENLTLTGALAINGTGNSLNNEILGNTAANALSGGGGDDFLDGGAGADALTGGTGGDLYQVDNVGDTVTELTGEGSDTVWSSVTFTLAANVENLELQGSSALDGTGNDLANILTGNAGSNILTGLAGNDTLDGGDGADTLKGGLGDDLYYADGADTLVEATGEGTDTAVTSVSYMLAAGVELEVLRSADRFDVTAIDLTGNAYGQQILGNDGANDLNGGGGNDTLVGYDGDDNLDGGTGNDQLEGGQGNDHYWVDSVGDVVVDTGTIGIDYVHVSIGTYTLTANVEGLYFESNIAALGTGNDLNNYIFGPATAAATIYGLGGDDEIRTGSGNDLIDGGAGRDWMVGGAGNDTYYVHDAFDAVVESFGGGTDQVFASVSHGMFSDVERLTLTGTEAIDGYGNELANVMVGNGASNTLSGSFGNDILTGGAGLDSLEGGDGADTFQDTKAGLSGDTILDLSIGDRIILTDATLAGFTFSLTGTTLTYTGGTLSFAEPLAGTLVASAGAGGGVQLTIGTIQDAANDFNGDGRSDIMFRHDNGAITNFLGTANGGILNNGDNVYTVVDNAWDLAGTGDFNGDGRDDVLWQGDNGAIFNILGTANGGVTNNGDNSYMQLNAGWTVSGIGDFNGDGREDILFRDANGVIFDYLGTASGGFTGNANNLYTDIADAWHSRGLAISTATAGTTSCSAMTMARSPTSSAPPMAASSTMAITSTPWSTTAGTSPAPATSTATAATTSSGATTMARCLHF